MRLGCLLEYAGDPHATIDKARQLEAAGVDDLWVPEAYGFDGVSMLGYLACTTTTVRLGSSILNVFSRTPGTLAQIAAGVDALSGGRFVLGLGASGPQVIEGWHGIPYARPLGRTREVVEVIRRMLRRDVVEFAGDSITLPLPPEQGLGQGKPLKMLTQPVRDRVPIYLAALGPKNVELTSEIADGWFPLFFLPERSDLAWGEARRAGEAKRDDSLGELEIAVGGHVALVDDPDDQRRALDQLRPYYALYIGGMGSREQNFYNQLVARYGWEQQAAQIQELYLSGDKDAAAALVPHELLELTNLVGSEGFVKDRLAAFADAGVTTVNVNPLGPMEDIERVAALTATM